MKSVIAFAALVLTVSVLTIACGGGNQQQEVDAPEAGASTSEQNVEVTFTSEPDPPKTGENTFGHGDVGRAACHRR
jgi:ABC-type glycerol-3-phosphate transport system substrate-binding protein